jgi:hypothetical protein
VEFDGQNVVEVKDECNNNFLRSHKVCVENYESRPDGIFACNVRIEKMAEVLEGKTRVTSHTSPSVNTALTSLSTGKWTIRVERTDRRRAEETVDFDLEMAELPKSLKLTSAGREVRGRDIL